LPWSNLDANSERKIVMSWTPAVLAAVLSLTLIDLAAAQGASAAAPQSSVSQQLDDQNRRIAALEAQLVALQRQIAEMRGASVERHDAIDAPPAPVADEEEPPFEHAAGGQPPHETDPHSPSGDLPRALPVDAYGSLRVATAIDTDGRSEVRNNASRLGLRGEKKLGDFAAFARVEVGINLVANDRVILTGGDPGAPIGQGSQAITSRLGLVGIQTPVGAVSWGKQWSPYYDVAEFTDQFHVFSGAANGAFGTGDGGIAGTGRAERAFQYRERKGPVSVALQVQNRTSSANDRGWADAYGGSVLVGRFEGLSVAAAYNEVRDGVENPTPNDPLRGDKAALFGVRYRSDQWYAAGTYSIQRQHTFDDLGRIFDGHGFELAVRRMLAEHWWVEGGYNDLRPDSDHPGDYHVRFGVGNVVYVFGDASRVFAGFKIEGSRRSDGSRLADSALAAGLNFTF
jgi:predicted porin/cell division protein FtsB